MVVGIKRNQIFFADVPGTLAIGCDDLTIRACRFQISARDMHLPPRCGTRDLGIPGAMFGFSERSSKRSSI
jgi:hypothetical protein